MGICKEVYCKSWLFVSENTIHLKPSLNGAPPGLQKTTLHRRQQQKNKNIYKYNKDPLNNNEVNSPKQCPQRVSMKTFWPCWQTNRAGQHGRPKCWQNILLTDQCDKIQHFKSPKLPHMIGCFVSSKLNPIFRIFVQTVLLFCIYGFP